MKILYEILFFIFCYVLGQISYARLFVKKNNKKIEEIGSGNPGTMNMVRNFGFKTGLITLIIDALKGIIASLLGLLLFGTTAMYIAGTLAVVGHIFPIIYKFKGGKGIATTLGFLLVVNPLVAFIFFILTFIGILFTRYGSFMNILFVVHMVIIQTVYHNENVVGIVCLWFVVLLVIMAHRTNLRRLLLGKETQTDIGAIILKKKKNSDLTKTDVDDNTIIIEND